MTLEDHLQQMRDLLNFFVDDEPTLIALEGIGDTANQVASSLETMKNMYFDGFCSSVDRYSHDDFLDASYLGEGVVNFDYFHLDKSQDPVSYTPISKMVFHLNEVFSEGSVIPVRILFNNHYNGDSEDQTSASRTFYDRVCGHLNNEKIDFTETWRNQNKKIIDFKLVVSDLYDVADTLKEFSKNWMIEYK
jgi:hypothetical protein